MGATVVTVTGQFQNEDGTAASGTVQFQLTGPISNSGITTWPVPLTVTLNGSGAFSVPLVANDDTATSPQGSGYTVIERVTSTSNREYNITVPSSAPGGTCTLASLMPGQPGWG